MRARVSPKNNKLANRNWITFARFRFDKIINGLAPFNLSLKANHIVYYRIYSHRCIIIGCILLMDFGVVVALVLGRGGEGRVDHVKCHGDYSRDLWVMVWCGEATSVGRSIFEGLDLFAAAAVGRFGSRNLIWFDRIGGYLPFSLAQKLNYQY